MANGFRRGTPGGVIPSPTGGGLSGAVAGFAEMREMARRARMEQQQHELEMQRFQAQLKESEMGQLATQLQLLEAVSEPGQRLVDLAPGVVPELASSLQLDPEQLGGAVLKPIGPEHVIGQGAAAFLEQATPDQLARIGEIASASGKTLDEIAAQASQGRYVELVSGIQRDWIRNNPELFEEAIGQELGPDQLYSIDVFEHELELTGRDAAGTLLDMQRLLDAREQGNAAAAAENRDNLIQWGRDIAEDLEITGMVPIINEMVNLMTDPDIEVDEYVERRNNIAGRSREARLLIEAMEEGRAVGTSALLNQYRDDPELGPVINMLDFATQMMETGAFTAEQGMPMLKSLTNILKARGISGVSTGIPLIGSPSFDAPDPIEQISQRFGGQLSRREIEGALTQIQEAAGISHEEAVQQMLTGDVEEMRPAAEPAPTPSEPEPDLPSVPGGDPSALTHREPGTGTRSFSIERARRQLDTRQRQLQLIEERAPDNASIRRRKAQLEEDIARLEAIIQGGS